MYGLACSNATASADLWDLACTVEVLRYNRAESTNAVNMGESNESAAARVHAANVAAGETGAVPPRPEGAVYMGGFCAPALEQVRVAVIGLGENRGMAHARLLAAIPHCRVVAVCDVHADAAEQAAVGIESQTGSRPAIYHGSPAAYLHMLAEQQPEAVFVCTPWETHAQVAVEVMEHGAHAFVEVPLGLTLEELWRVVDTAERTQRHCMMLENVNYGREELLFLHIVRLGLIGKLLHGEAAYMHDLRMQMSATTGRGCGSWRTYHYAARNGNLYPTHGLGPVAQYMSLARGEDTFERIVSLGSPALGRAAYAHKNFPPEHRWNHLQYRCADVSSSIIRTRAGRTILLQWDETTPAPYDRRNSIRGTEGALAGFPLRVAGERLSPALTEDQMSQTGLHDPWRLWYQGPAAEQELYTRYEHPLYRRLGAAACAVAGRKAMDYIMLYRIIECLHQGLPMDQNVYEGALWSAVAPLSEKSVCEGGAPQLFPDFTRGSWSSTPALGIVR